MPDETSVEKTKHEKIVEISNRLGEILALHGGLESNIPVDGRVPNEYWTLKAELNALRAAP